MPLRFASLGSGSRGNATLVEGNGTRLLVDCGFSLREFEARCRRLEVEPDSIQALLVTHEHGDHVRGVGPLARKYRLPVWMTHGTHRGSGNRCGELPDLHLFGPYTPGFRIGALQVRPYAVPHDAREPVQFLLDDGRCTLGLLTDAGCITPSMVERLGTVDALLLECNHDPDMLRTGPYPPRLQARVGGDYGHLSNGQAAGLLARLEPARFQHLVLGHLSEKNNRPRLARSAVLERCPGLEERLTVLAQESCSHWFVID